MTSIQVENKKVKETTRTNKVNELIKEKTLAETIANNLRNYELGIDKNDITALANSQLNSREMAKIAETVRSNLAKELETNRSNLSNEAIKQLSNYIDLLKPTGRNVSAILASLAANQVLADQLGVKLDPITSSAIKVALSQFGIDINDLSWENQNLPTTQNSAGKVWNSPNNSGYYLAENEPTRTSENYYYQKRGYANQHYSSDKEREYRTKDKNEIPTDVSNSHGPNSEIVTTGKSNTKSEGYYTQESTPSQAGVYYSPGASNNYGPGFI